MRPLFLLATTALLALPLPAQQPAVTHAQLTTEAAPAGPRPALDRLTHSGQTAWLAYIIPTEQPFYSGSHSPATAYLENDHSWTSNSSSNSSDSPQDHALLLFRVADHHLSRLRVENPNRTLDAAGLPLLFLTGVSPESSLDLLQTLALSPNLSDRPLRDALIFSISLHRSPSTVPTLTSLADPARDPELREKAAFWLGTSTDQEAFRTLQHLARTDPDSHFREKLAFDLTLGHHPAALDELIRMAHADPAPNVRKQAQFWMANIGGDRITADLRTSADSDPNTEVRNSAVFALSRLPADQSTPQLIHVAQTNSSPEVRKQAVFWLGQSSDPNALAFLTKLLQP